MDKWEKEEKGERKGRREEREDECMGKGGGRPRKEGVLLSEVCCYRSTEVITYSCMKQCPSPCPPLPPPDLLGSELVKRLLCNTCMFLSSKRREVVMATLEFVKVTVGVLPANELLPHVEELVRKGSGSGR